MFGKRRAEKRETQKFSDGNDGRDNTQETSDKTDGGRMGNDERPKIRVQLTEV